ERLCARGDAAATAGDADKAQTWYEYAIAVDPDAFRAWDGLAKLARPRGAAAWVDAERAALAAYERAVAPSAASLAEHATRVQRLADACTAAGDAAAARGLYRRAHELSPMLAGAALAVVDERLAQDRHMAAFWIV